MSGKVTAAPQQAPGARKRAVRSQRSRASQPPEPKDVVTSAGQALDAGLRRDMESRFGHDFSRVRIHNDRDAAALADLVGAEAVTVGQDVFFAEGAFHPETAEGRRLLAHELLHTVQVPHAPGPLRLGRQSGALSQPHEPIEQEAEEQARGGGQALPAVREQGAQAASWLRFTRVTAEQRRTEQLDPATLVDRLVAGVLRSLRGDPTDASGRVRLQIGRLAPELRSAVLDTLEVRLPSSEFTRVLELVAQADALDNVDSVLTPEPVTDTAERTETERDRDENAKRADREHQQWLDEDASKEHNDETKRPDGSEKEPDAVDKKPEAGDADKTQPAKDKGGEQAGKEQAGKDKAGEQAGKDGTQAQQPQQPAEGGAPGGPPVGPPAGEPAAPAPQEAAAQPAAVSDAVGSPEQQRQAAQGEPPAGMTPQVPAPRAGESPAPVRPERVDRIAEGNDSPLVRHGLLDRGDSRQEPGEQEQPLGLEPGADKDIDPPKDEAAPTAAVAPRPELKPEDFLPQTDLDVSGVPTADQMTLPADGAAPAEPAIPSFPEPPATKAEQVQAEAEPEADTEAPVAPVAPQEAAPVASTPGDAAAADTAAADQEQTTQTANDLQTEKPLHDEVGPDPETASPTAPEPASPAETGARAEERPEPESPVASEASAAPAEPAGAGAGSAAPMGEADAGPVGGFAGPAVAGPVGGAEPAGIGGVAPAADLAGPGPEPAAGPVEAPGEGGAPGAVAPEASLEPGGGDCAGPQQPGTESDKPEGGEGGCGAGGGGGAPGEQAKEQPPAPDVSGQDPQSALATVGSLPPDQMGPALSSVDRSVDRTVSEKHAAVKAAPPTMQRPSGAPQTLAGQPTEAPMRETKKVSLERVVPERAGGQNQPQDKQVQGNNPASQVSAPQVAGDTQGKVAERDVKNVQQAINDVPTTDPALHATVGEAPKVELAGETNPALTDQQAGKLAESSQQIHGTGREEAATPLGEDQIYPNAPSETLTAQVPSGGGGGAAAGGQGSGGADAGVAAVAQQERGPQIQAGVAQGQAQMGTEQKNQQQGAAQANAEHQAEVSKTLQENSQAQTTERGKAAEDAKAKREEWRTEQDKKVAESNTEAGKEHDKARSDITNKKTDTDKETDKKKQEDNDKINHERAKAEEEARKKKESKKKESEGGFFDWLASKVVNFFKGLLDAVTKIFEAAVKLVNDVIKEFGKAITGLINLARDAIVGFIKALADVLIKLCDVLAVFFPELAAKMRKAIEDLRDAAIAVVNKLAEALKAGVEFLLNKLAEALTGLLRLLEAGLKAAINAVRDVVVGAIDFAKQAIAAFGQFAALVADIAADPGGWLKNLGTAAADGVQHYLWGAIKSAVKQWFNEKVESVLGLGKVIIDVLVKGCMSIAAIGRMAWEAIIQALPGMIISLVVEKLISMLVPAAGAILTIIQGLMAAWDTISKIIAAFGKFFAFLKAVKGGGVAAACLFAGAVAAGVVALLDFITNFLLQRLGNALKGVATKLKGIAQKVMKGLSKAGKGARKAAGGAVNRARQGLRTASQALRGPALAGHGGPGAMRRPKVAGRPRTGAHPQRPQPQRPPSRRPEQHATGEHPTTRPAHHEPAPHQPAAPKPKPRPARPAISTAGRALQRVKSAVRSGLRKVRNATRALGRKLRNSKLARALTNTAKKTRDLYKRQRDRLKDHHKKRQQQRKQQRDERRKHENSPESKQQRLDLIVARIRPNLEWMLRRGVPNFLLRSILRAQWLWYRLSSLNFVGGNDFRIVATVNPGTEVIAGVTVEKDRLVLFIRRLATQLQAKIEARRRRAIRTGTGTFRGRDVPEHEVGPEIKTPSVSRFLMQQKPEGFRATRLIKYLNESSDPDVVRVWQGTPTKGDRERTLRNQMVVMHNPLTGAPANMLSHDQLVEWTRGFNKKAQRNIARSALHMLAGRAVPETNRTFVREMVHWVQVAEENRRGSGRVTTAMIFDMAGFGQRPRARNLANALTLHPVRARGSQDVSYLADDYIGGRRAWQSLTGGQQDKVQDIIDAEVAVVKAWAESLNINVPKSVPPDRQVPWLYDQIRRRMYRIYDLPYSTNDGRG